MVYYDLFHTGTIQIWDHLSIRKFLFAGVKSLYLSKARNVSFSLLSLRSRGETAHMEQSACTFHGLCTENVTKSPFRKWPSDLRDGKQILHVKKIHCFRQPSNHERFWELPAALVFNADDALARKPSTGTWNKQESGRNILRKQLVEVARVKFKLASIPKRRTQTLTDSVECRDQLQPVYETHRWVTWLSSQYFGLRVAYKYKRTLSATQVQTFNYTAWFGFFG